MCAVTLLRLPKTGALVAAVLALAACEVAEDASPDSRAEAAPATPASEAPGRPETLSADIEFPDDFDLRAFRIEALDLTQAELEAMREAALARGGFELFRYAIALQARGEPEALFELLDAIAPQGNEENYRFVAAVLLEDWSRYPDRLVRIAEHAHGAGMMDTFLIFADWASDPEFPLDAYDRVRLGRMLAGIERADAHGHARHLGHLFYNGSETLGLEPDPERGAEFMEMAAMAGDGEQAHEIARMYFEANGVPQDVKRAVDIYIHSGDKGDEFAYNNAAWIMVTCPQFTAGERLDAQRWIERSIDEHGATSTRVDTLAAVHARLGNHHEAALAQQRALELFEAEGRDPVDFPDMERRLGVYRQGRAYDDPACHTRPGK